MATSTRARSLRARRLLTGMSQGDVAQVLDTHQTVISKIENGHRLTERETVVADLLDDLLPRLKGSQPVTPEERAAVLEWIDARLEDEEMPSARRLVLLTARQQVERGVEA